MVAVMQAHVKVDSAKAALIPALSRNQAYQDAESEVSAANAALQSARANDAPASPELVAAAQRYVDAKAAVQKIVNAAAATDPQTIAARQELDAAQSDLRAAQQEMKTSAATGKE
jgi:chromosome segregation ATPase